MKPILKGIFARSLTVFALAGATSVRARAQLVDSRKTLTLAGAEKVIAAAKAEAKEQRGWGDRSGG